MGRSTHRLLSPIADVDEQDAGLAPRLSELNGKVIGFIDNGQPGVSTFIQALERVLATRFTFADVVRIKKERAGKPCSDKELARLAGCHLVVAGIGL